MKKMKKKRMSLIRVVTSLALAGILCLGLSMPALATETDPNVSYGTDGADATAAITKQLAMAEGTTSPGIDFTFSITAIAGGLDHTGDYDLATDPPNDIKTRTISFYPGDEQEGDGRIVEDDGGIVTIYKSIDDIFSGFIWPHAGVFGYIIEEDSTDYTGMVDSAASYKVYVYVANGTDGLYVEGISAYRVSGDGNNDATDTPKVNPGLGLVSGKSALAFWNQYTETSSGTDPTDPDHQVLRISKTVVGAFGDQTKYFPFTLELTKAPTFDNSDQTYLAYVVESTGIDEESGKETFVIVADPSENYDGVFIQPDEDNEYIHFEVTTGTPINFALKHGQSLVFVQMHYGTEYEAVESGSANYKPSAVIVEGGVTTDTLDSAGFNDPLSTDIRTVEDTGENSAAFTNTYELTSPTGVIVDNLAYIVLIVAALAGLVAFMAFKSRRRAESEQ